jgi:hypothetical protein
MNESCWKIRNSRTFWLSSCSLQLGNISCLGCEMKLGRNMSARSIYGQFIYDVELNLGLIMKKTYLPVAIMRFLSHFLANTLRRCRTYKNKYWFARDMRRMRDLYVAMTCS